MLLGGVMNGHLRARYPETWEALGRPSPLNNSIANGVKSLRFFVLSSKYKSLADKKLNVYVWILRFLNVLVIVLLVLGAILMAEGRMT